MKNKKNNKNETISPKLSELSHFHSLELVSMESKPFVLLSRPPTVAVEGTKNSNKTFGLFSNKKLLTLAEVEKLKR